MLSVTQSPPPRPSTTPLLAVSIALLIVGAFCLCFSLGLDRAEKMFSIVGSLAGVAGAAAGIVALLRIRAASATPPPRDVPRGGIYSGRDTHVGHKVNTGGVFAVGGMLATLYLAVGAVGVAQSTAGDADIASLGRDWLSGTSAKRSSADTDATALPQLGGVADKQQLRRRLSLKLSTSTVRIDDTYVATVAGLSPGERVLLHWTGPSSGTIAILTADSGGRARTSVHEGADPGNYTIKVDAERSGQTAEAPLRVVSGG